MSGEPTQIDDGDDLLARTARMDFAFAEHVQRRALESQDPAELDVLARASARLTRSMRQNLALLGKQKTERAKADRDAARADIPKPQPRSEAEIRAERDMDQIQTGVTRIIVAEAGSDRPYLRDLLYRFDREMADWEEQPDFEDYEPDVIIRHACYVLDLPAELADRWRTLPDPEWLPDPEPAADADEDEAANVHCWPPFDPPSDARLDNVLYRHVDDDDDDAAFANSS